MLDATTTSHLPQLLEPKPPLSICFLALPLMLDT